jgi:putative addiction module component (TIGR02574 family)
MLSFMSIPLEKIAEVALSLPSDARALLADRLVESLDPLTDETVRQAWATESLRRRDDVRAGKVVTISETDVARRVRALLK